MTNLTTASTHNTARGYSHQAAQHSDGAPMSITRLSGWIDMSETKILTPSWIIRTRRAARVR
jgi:hypothetical protein